MNKEKEKNNLRCILEKSKIEKIDLYEEITKIEKLANSKWIPILGQDKGSLNGPVHLSNVESIVCSILELANDLKLSNTEAFILLSAIIYHDYGKILDISPELKPKKESYLFTTLRSYKSKEDHEYKSAIGILLNYDELGFSDFKIAECVSILCASHSVNLAKILKSRGYIEKIFLDRYGLIRLDWLSVLLVFADEMDNSFHRSAADWIKSSEKKVKGSHRAKLNGCEMDTAGKQLIVHLRENFFEDTQDFNNDLYWVLKDLENKYKLLCFWQNSLRQMSLELYDVTIKYKGHIFGILHNKTIVKTKDNTENLQLLVEPFIRQFKFDLIFDACISMRLKSFGRTTFSWSALACEAGIEKENEAKTVFHRISLLAQIYFNSHNHNTVDYLRIISEGTQNNTVVNFIELDDEWTIEFGNEYGKNILINFYKWATGIISGKCYISKNIKKLKLYYKIKNDNLSYLLNEKSLSSTNIEDDLQIENSIEFPKTNSIVNEIRGYNNSGLNIIICGPPGVGKTTLAMELLNTGSLKRKDEKDYIKSIFAYCSLEQPINPIEELCSEKLNIKKIDDLLESYSKIKKNRNERTFLREPEFIKLYRNLAELENKNKILIFPSLVPNTYAFDELEINNLFWYRYKQILRLIEGDRFIYDISRKNSKLTAIIIDSLNGFVQNELHRSYIHQIFRMISWSGLLGIYIVENTKYESQKNFIDDIEYLSDIVINLDWIRDDYQYKFIEISKSRNQRHVLGRHPFKIKRDKGHNSVIEIYPSLHTQVSRFEKLKIRENKSRQVKFSVSDVLNNIVHITDKKIKLKETGVSLDSFIITRGRSGGHKLAIGMSYIHCLEKLTDKELGAALIINLGQQISYFNVADNKIWAPKGSVVYELNQKLEVSTKINLDIYYNKKNQTIIFVLNFHSGFLLPEEFIYIVTSIINSIKYDPLKIFNNIQTKSRLLKQLVNKLKTKKTHLHIQRSLFNSAGHLPERYPLLNKDPLFLHAVARIFKQNEIGLMVIAVEGVGIDQQINSLSAIADLKINILTINNSELFNRERIKNIKKELSIKSNVRIITSDNVTGKDYNKRFGIFYVKNKNLYVDLIKEEEFLN